MVCTDGWIDQTQRITPHGYIGSQADDWVHDWAWWATYLKSKASSSACTEPLVGHQVTVTNPGVTVVGRPDIKVADIVNPGDYFDGGGWMQWVDPTRDGAEEYVKGYVDYFHQLGVVFLRMDFLAWYEVGFDQSEGTVGGAHGRDSYLQALQWMREAAGDMQLSLVMPNLFDHGSGERRFGDLIRIDNDVSFGTWYDLSEGRRRGNRWSQWNNPFLGFTGFADLSGRGQLILDGDPLMISPSATPANGNRDQPVHHGRSPDRHHRPGRHDRDNAHFFQNPEVLGLRKAGLVGKPVYNNGHGFDFDPSSRDPEVGSANYPTEPGWWACSTGKTGQGPEPSQSTSPPSSASAVRPRSATCGPTRTWDR